MDNVVRQRQYVMFFIEDLLETFLNRDVSLWHAERSAYQQIVHAQVPDIYRFKRFHELSIDITHSRFRDLCEAEAGKVLHEIERSTERRKCVHTTIENLLSDFDELSPNGFLAFLTTVAALSRVVCDKYDNSLIPTIVAATTSRIIRNYFGDTYGVFQHMKVCAVTFLRSMGVYVNEEVDY